MSFNLDNLIRKNIRRMKPYASARSEFSGNDAGTIFLDANEQPQAFEGLPVSINRYPRHNQEQLRQRLALIKEVREEQIFLGNGSDEAIDMILRCFARPGQDEIMVFPPTFGMYAVSADMNDLGVNKVPLDNEFMIDEGKALAAVSRHTRAMFVCNPNNPTGNLQKRETITSLLKQFDGLVVVDEAYIDFAPGSSMLPLLDQFPNLIVLQTFSKAWGLAGARVGVAYASSEIIAVLNKVRFPYNLSLPDSQLAIQALNKFAEYKLGVAESLENRNHLATAIAVMPHVTHIYPSSANFLLVRTTGGDALYRYFRDHGVIVRNRSSEPGCEDCLRITVGTPEENQRLLDIWEKYGISTQPGISNQSAGLSSVECREDSPASDYTPAAAGDAPSQTPRRVVVSRATSETDITIRLTLDGTGRANIQTGIGFFDHMLHQIARHGLFDLDILASGDLHIDPHHTIEDTAITLGQAFRKALGNKAGIERYGFALPMDDAEAKVLIDFGGRFFLKWSVGFDAPYTGEVPSSLYEHFFRSFAEAAAANLHIKARGKDDHHKIEAVFKAFAKATKMAVSRNKSGILPSTKGNL
jgi:histidinol-phosphate aminotransferase